MSRWAFTIATAASLLLFTVTVTLWAWSNQADGQFGRTRIKLSAGQIIEYRCGFFSASGTVYLANGTIIASAAGYPGYVSATTQPATRAPAIPAAMNRFGWFTGPPGRFGWFYAERDEGFNNGGWGSNGELDLFGTSVRWDQPQYGVIALPHWYFVLLFAVLPTWWVLLFAGLARRPWKWPLIVLASLAVWGLVMIQAPLCGLFVVPVAMAIPILVVLERVRKRQRAVIESLLSAKVCRRCGYDLRATPNRCPECGTATTATVKA